MTLEPLISEGFWGEGEHQGSCQTTPHHENDGKWDVGAGHFQRNAYLSELPEIFALGIKLKLRKIQTEK